jgi:LPS sulfotransferase NodH
MRRDGAPDDSRLGQPFRRFIVLALPRTGSSRLIEALGQHPLIVANGEALNPHQSEYSWAHEMGDSTELLIEIGFTLLGPQNAGKRGFVTTGFKVLDEQVADGSRHSRALDLLAADMDIRVLHLTRNPMESLRSHVQAGVTGQWQVRVPGVAPPPVYVPAQQCQEFFQRAAAFELTVRRRFLEHEILHVTYERMESSLNLELTRIHSFLGVYHRPITRETLIRQEARPLGDTLINFRELKMHFRDTPYASLFAEEAGLGTS